jgi:VWFA-related protein
VRRPAILALLVLITCIARGAAQPGPALRFISPTAETYVSGPVLLRIEVDGVELGAIENVTFFADGRQVCVAPGMKPECAWDAGGQLKEHALRAVARLRAGGRLVANVRTLSAEYVESVSVDAVLANAIVTDGGRFVTGLPREAFRLFDDARERPITSFQSTDALLEVVLALDVSESMRDVLPDVKTAAITFVKALRPQDHITLVAFNDTMFVPVRSAANADVVAKAIGDLSAFGATALFDVAVKSLELLSRQSGKHALVLFTDGDDRSSQAGLEELQRVVDSGDAMVFAIGLGPRERREQLRDRLELITGSSGGRVLVADKSEDLKDSFTEVVRDVVNQYTLGFEPRRDGRSHTIKVELVGRGGRVRARRSYIAPPTSTAPRR